MEVLTDIWRYSKQMLPLASAALLVFWMTRSWRRTNSKPREILLAVFVAYCAGLAALTLFPANFWTFSGQTKLFSPWETALSNLAHLPQMLTPFHEIDRVLRRRTYWGIFLLAGNIAMFLPIGFFPALLWKNWKWWKSLLAGFCASCTIEFVQLFIGRSTDVDDVILNSAGALAGFLLCWVCKKLLPEKIWRSFYG